MIKRYVVAGLSTLLLSFPLYSDSAQAGNPGSSQTELQSEIEMLKNIVLDLNERLAATEEMLQMSLEQQEKQTEQSEEVEELVDELDKRVSDNEKHSALDRLTLGVDLESNFNSIHMETKSLPGTSSIMIGQMAFASKQFSPDEMKQFQTMFRSQSPEDQSVDNDALFTTRLRIDMKARPVHSLSFVGRLSANKVFGDSTGVKWYNGGPNAVTMDGNVHSTGSDSALRVERAFFTYFGDLGSSHYHFSLGRRPALGGSPSEFSASSVVGGSPMSHGINWQFDGASLGFGLDEATGIPGFNFKLCWGVGFESGIGSGNSYSMSYNSDVDDMQFAGWIFNIFEQDETKITNMYAHAFNVTDGFTGLVATPFTISGLDNNGDGSYDQYEMNMNSGGFISRTEPTANIGTIDIMTLLGQTQIGNVGFFVDIAASHAQPSGVSRNPMLQFLGTDGLLNSNGEQSDRTGYSVWAGIKSDLPGDGTIGFEYNWGSQYWIGFTGGEDNVAGSKLATRGSVYELFYNQPLVENKLLFSLGGQYYDYEYSGSGNPMGEPVKISELTALDSFMPVVDTMWNIYANLAYRW
ncbi:MAG: DUF3373 family protein [Thermodesulfobacteriota bacterium]